MYHLEEEPGSENNILYSIMLYYYRMKAEIISKKGEGMAANNKQVIEEDRAGGAL